MVAAGRAARIDGRRGEEEGRTTVGAAGKSSEMRPTGLGEWEE